jgi:multidrug efflux pump subunit AcrA (membrane-fusion protein)
MKKNWLLVLSASFVLLLSWCGNSKDDQKKDFLVDVISFDNQDQEVYITKPGKVSGNQDIVVSSQVAGRVKKILKRDWDIVSSEQLVVDIADTIANYGLQVQRAKSAVGRASLQRQQTQISLEKSLVDVSTALDVAKNNQSVTQLSIGQSLKQAELGLSTSVSQWQNLQLQFPMEKNNLLDLIDKILHQVDTYLWATEKYRSYNDSFEIYLWAKNSSLRNQAEIFLFDLYRIRWEVAALPSQVTDLNAISTHIDTLQKGYDASKKLLDSMRDVLINSIAGASFPQTVIDGYKSTIEWLNSALQWSKTGLLGYRKQITSSTSSSVWGSVLDVPKTQAEIAYETARISTENAVFSADVGLKSAENNYQSLMKNQNVQIGMAWNAVYEASLSYQDALSRFNNLSVKAPIAGVVGNVLVDVGQEVGPGTPLFTLSSKDQQTIEMYVTADERSYIDKDQFVKIRYDDQEFTGKIMSISSVADRNTLYKVVVAFDDSVSLLGDVASVQLPISLPYIVLPINVVTPVTENKWFVWLLNGTGLQKQPVELGRVWESYVEVLSWITQGMNIVVTDVSYFDSRKFTLKATVQ